MPRAEITIRRARPADLDAVDALEAASFTVDRYPRRALARLLRSKSAATLLAECESGPLGYILLLFRKGATAARLYSLATAPEARGKGVAARLVQAAAACAIERGCDRLRLELRQSNAAAARVYDRAGFQSLKTTPGYYDDGESALHMEMRLESGKRRAR